MKSLARAIRASWILCLALFLASTAVLVAQTNRGAISGTVFDPQGAVVPGASVTVINIGTNQKFVTKTSNAGTYVVSNLDPVTYRVEVEMQGFKKAIYDGVKVDTATSVTRNIEMQTGSVETTVSVEAQAPIINTESGTQTQNITARQMQDVPLFNRSVLDLALTAPNVTGAAGSEDADVTSGQPVPGFNLSINGGRAGTTTMLADGANNTGVGIARAVVEFTPETVQEFSVQTSNYSAEYGQTGGGVINVTTKSGTNDFHGVALWYTRNPITNAEKWTAGSTRPPNNLRFNQFSGTLGGPVWIPKVYDGHNKTFFFFGGEPRYRLDFLVVDTQVPSDAMRAGDFSNLVRTTNGWLPADVAAKYNLSSIGPATIYQQYNLVNGQWKRVSGNPVAFTGNVIPKAFLDPNAVAALQYMPEPGPWHLDSAGHLQNLVVNRFVKQNETRWTMRIDHNVSEKNKLNFRYTYVPAAGVRGFGSDVNGNSAAYSWARQFVIGDTHLITNRLMNDLRVSYSRGTFSEDYSPEFNIKTGRNLSTELGLPSLTHGGMPLLQISSDSSSSFFGYNAFSNIGSAGSTNNYNKEERYNIVDMVYWDRGSMRWKFGVDLTHALLNVAPFFGAAGGRWDFRVAQTSAAFGSTSTANGGNPFASYLMGIPNQIAVRPLLLNYYYRWNAAAAFIQNDWKVKPNFTLNLGVRYGLQLPRTEKNNLQGSFRPDLAQQFPLATPITLPGTNLTLSSFNVVPFQFAGHGSSKYIQPIERWDFEPRLGFAWSPSMYHDKLVVHGGYGISHESILGNNRLPNPDFGGFVNASTLSTPGTAGCGTAISTGSVDPCSALRMTGNPAVSNTALSPAQALNIPANGLVYLPSLGIPGYVVSPHSHIPYVHSWNLAIQHEIIRNSVLEIGYVGSKGANLYTQLINVNPRDFNLIQQMQNSVAVAPGSTGTAVQPIGTETTFNDPLGRKDLLGNTIAIPWGSLASTYQGFNNLNEYFNAQASSIRHAGYVSFTRRMKGLEATVNYTYSKSMDNASDASPDTRTLVQPTTSGGNITFGAPLSSDYSISAFDQPHWLTARYVYDLPFGRGQAFLSHAWAPVNAIIGGWTTSGVVRLNSEYPFLPTLSDANGLNATTTHTVRPDINPNQPLINPLYDRNCVTVATCEPYVNPAAFIRPVKGTLGNAGRTLAIRGPLDKFFDASLQKSFALPGKWGAEGKRRIQFRVDALNAFNHPNFQTSSGNAGPDFMGAPNEGTVTVNTSTGVKTFTPLTTTEYNSWAAFNNQPCTTGGPSSCPVTTAGTTQYNNIVASINAQRQSSGALPTNFWTVPLPQGFVSKDANSFDIRDLNGFKLYRLRQAYGGTSFGQLRELQLPRYLQFGVRIFF